MYVLEFKIFLSYKTAEVSMWQIGTLKDYNI